MIKIIPRKIALLLLLLPYKVSTLMGSKPLYPSFLVNLRSGISSWTSKLRAEPTNYRLALVKRSPVEKEAYIAWVKKEKCNLLVDGYCKQYDIPKDILSFIIFFLYNNPTQYKENLLPKNLSGRDLRGFVLTGCKFCGINLTDTKLDGAILEDTTCYYQAIFQKDSQKRSNNFLCKGRGLSRCFKDINMLYSNTESNHLRAVLLHIACGLSRVTLYDGTDLEIKIMYWISEWLHFRLNQCSQVPLFDWANNNLLDMLLIGDLEMYSWKTSYPQNQVTSPKDVPHTNFDRYIKEFEKGLTTYQCQSKVPRGFSWYKKSIIQTIQELKQAYPKIKEEKLQEEACYIAQALSKSYQIQELVLLNHYLAYQNRLIRLRNLAKIKLASRGIFILENVRSNLLK